MTPAIVDWRNWRTMTWVLVAANALFCLSAIVMVTSAGNSCEGLRGEVFESCVAGYSDVAGFAFAALVGLWLVVDVILGILWFVTWRPSTRECPECDLWVDRVDPACPECGHSFAAPPAAQT